MDVHRTSMSSIELGKLNVRLDTLVQIANGLDMPAWELLRIAEVGAGSGEPPRAGGGGSREPPYGREATKSPSDAAGRRKVAEEKRRYRQRVWHDQAVVTPASSRGCR